MKLKSIEYSQYENQPNNWSLEGCTLEDVNLIVGKNATGKTKTLNVIAGLANLLSGANRKLDTGKFKAVFEDIEDDIQYLLEWKNKKIVSEQLTQGQKRLLYRNIDGDGKIFASQLNLEMEFQPPVDELAVVNRRDAIQHPYLNKLHVWGESAIHFRFGTPMGQDHLAVFVAGLGLQQELNLKDTNQVVAIFHHGQQKYGSEYTNLVIQDMSRLGYELEEIDMIDVVTQTEQPAIVNGLQLKERDLNSVTNHYEISTGMFRALSLLIQLNFSLLEKSPSCLIIDDVGEGLDYSRSTTLIDILIEKVTGTTMQLIMATNDQFVMNRVPLEYWSVIQRLPHKSQIYNYRNAPELFDSFEFTGLSNFDLLSSDYLIQEGITI